MNRFTDEFWNQRYKDLQIGWDVGGPTTPFTELFKSITSKDIKVLIPGCGYGHEGQLLFEMGFKNVVLLDVSELAREEFLIKNPSFPEHNYVIEDFFQHQGEYDLILEQTFFCALEPNLRSPYADKISTLLKPGGSLKGVLFNFELTEKGPPFGGNKKEYENYFSNLFEIKKLEHCYNSIDPRSGNELFIHLNKPLK